MTGNVPVTEAQRKADADGGQGIAVSFLTRSDKDASSFRLALRHAPVASVDGSQRNEWGLT
jgi:hypothetical protein